MGIKLLNRFLLDRCSKQSIYKTNLHQFANKTLVIDTSIYLYKFASESAIIEKMYLLISIFKKYSIEPIFIFDGKPPEEKRGLLHQRRIEKRDAQQKYIEMKHLLDNGEFDQDKRESILLNMESLKKQFIRIKESDIIKTKHLMDAYGVSYYDAPGEADVMCCQIVKSGRAYACLSDDMDMFAYGCARVLRHFSILNHTVIFYDTQSILKEIRLTEEDLCDILVLSGTDYNINNETNLTETMKWFHEYKRSNNSHTILFYDWLVKYTKYIKDIDHLSNIRSMFVLDDLSFQQREDKPMNMDKLKYILKDDGFVFVV